VIALLAVAWAEARRRWHRRAVTKAIDAALALVKEQNADFDANALRCALEAERQRRHETRHEDDDRGGPNLMAA
jgi:hypothetical protein